MSLENHIYGYALAVVAGFGFGAIVMDLAHERKQAQQAELPRKVDAYFQAQQLINCSDKPNAILEVHRICKARKRSAEVK